MSRDRDVVSFDQRASGYDEGWLGELHHQIADRAVQRAVTLGTEPHRVLDVGSGTGYLLRHLAKQLPGAAEFVGLDPAPQMVAEARKRAADPRLFVVRGVAERLPFADDAFDLVISTTSFDHWDDQDAGLRECARVLTTGGHFVLTDQFSAWLLPTLLMGRRDKARTRRRASARLARAGFHSLVWDDRVAMIMRTVTATV